MSINFNNLKDQKELEKLLKAAQNDPDVLLFPAIIPKAFQYLKREYERLVNLQKPVKSSEYTDPKFKLELDSEGGLNIEPDFKFVFKTKEKTKEKVFLNVVSHPIIDEPEQKELIEYEVILFGLLNNHQDRIKLVLEFQ